MKKIIYTKDMCGGCITLKKDLDRQGAVYEERDFSRLEHPEDEIDIKAFVEEVVMKNIAPKDISFPIEYDYQAEKV